LASDEIRVLNREPPNLPPLKNSATQKFQNFKLEKFEKPKSSEEAFSLRLLKRYGKEKLPNLKGIPVYNILSYSHFQGMQVLASSTDECDLLRVSAILGQVRRGFSKSAARQLLFKFACGSGVLTRTLRVLTKIRNPQFVPFVSPRNPNFAFFLEKKKRGNTATAF